MGSARVGHGANAVRKMYDDTAALRRVLHGVLEKCIQCPREQCSVRIDLVFAVCCKFGADGRIGSAAPLQALLRQF